MGEKDFKSAVKDSRMQNGYVVVLDCQKNEDAI